MLNLLSFRRIGAFFRPLSKMDGDHSVTAAFGRVKAAVTVQIRLILPMVSDGASEPLGLQNQCRVGAIPTETFILLFERCTRQLALSD